jgi:hypothetical protein
MTSYVKVIKIEDEDIVPQQESNNIIIKQDQLSDFLNKLELEKQIEKQLFQPPLLTHSQLVFLDINGEIIYDLYYELRDSFNNAGLFHKIDYNGFLDIFINNIKFEQPSDESDDEHNHDNDD